MRTAILLLPLLIFAQSPQRELTRAESTTEPATVLNIERGWGSAAMLLPLAQSSDAKVSSAALRALGRLEDPSLLPQLRAMLDSTSKQIRDDAAAAIAQTLTNVKPETDPALVADLAARLRANAGLGALEPTLALGRLPYAAPDDIAEAEKILVGVLDQTNCCDPLLAARANALQAFEWLARRNSRVPNVQYQPETVDRLESIVEGRHANDKDTIRLFALWTMIGIKQVTADAENSALSDSFDQVRRVAVQVLGGNGFSLDDQARAADLREALKDRSLLVRYEAVQSYAKKSAATQGCLPLLNALQDAAPHVVNAALDALGSACPSDDDVTTRIVAEARVPPVVGPWQREAHAFVALSKRDPERAGMIMQAFYRHQVWQVRMYAARAAAILKDETSLVRLAADENDNVREAAIGPLNSLIHERAQAAIVACLQRDDPQLLRTAATLLGKAPPAHALYRPLADAYVRVSRSQSETSRDARIALLDAIARHGTAEDSGELGPAVKDVDAQVARRASEVLAQWGRHVPAEVLPVAHSPQRMVDELRQCVAVVMKGGRSFRLRMDHDQAPITTGNFLHAALENRAYNGLTFHRVEPNFVIQGGSPGANEYSAPQSRFWRDEIGLLNTRGAVGLSTRGPNSADGQIYVMLVTDPRLDYRFTIFAHVFDPDMEVVDNVQEGDVIAEMKKTECR